MGDMKTLTITEAKKNLGKWLNAAVAGEDVGIINGSTIVAFRPVQVESTDYAMREYGLSAEELSVLDQRLAAENEKWRRSGKLVPTSKAQLEKLLEQTARHKPSTAKATRRTSKS